MRFSHLLVFVAVICSVNPTPIKNIVLIMFENRSFDHMLGYLKKFNPNIDGLTGDETNPWPQTNSVVKVSFDALSLIGTDPDHSVFGTNGEIWGSQMPTVPAPMDGFVATNNDSNVMRAYNSSVVPVIHTLARQGAVFDRWFASVPGPTQPNRLYLHSATSHGWARSPNAEDWLFDYPQRPMFLDLEEAKVSWGIYFSDFPVVLELEKLRAYPQNVHTLDDFFAHVKAGTLPTYSFLEPRWFDTLEWKENDQHPPHSAELGEYLMKDIYEAMRTSPQWNDSLLIITYDEHGGLYDHVAMPQSVPNPDGLDSTKPPFNFTRSGVRVPTVMVSPWLDADTVVHEVDDQVFDHTSVIGSLRRMYNLRPQPLTLREAWSAKFDGIFTRTSPRTDLPLTIPVDDQGAYDAWRAQEHAPKSDAAVAAMAERHPRAAEFSPPMNDLQFDTVKSAWRLTGGTADLNSVRTVHEGAFFCRDQLRSFLGRDPFATPEAAVPDQAL